MPLVERYVFGNTQFGDEEDWVDASTGALILPASEIPMAYTRIRYRPVNKGVYYNKRYFEVAYYHDGTVCEVFEISQEEFENLF